MYLSKMNRILLLIFILVSINLNAQSDFPDLKRQFLDYRKADKQDSALFIARKMNKLAQKEILNKYPTVPEKWAGFVLVR